ncbi:MAG: restriction endonuclease subunit S [Deltaproteobacteria bacterium]
MSSDWDCHKLSDVIVLISGGTPKTSIPEYWGGSIPWLSVADFNTGYRWVRFAGKTITDRGVSESATVVLKKRDIIISARGTVGALAQLAKPMAFNQSCYGIRGKQGITDTDFVYYALRQAVTGMKQLAHGGVFDTITRDTFKIIDVRIPPLHEQRAIAHLLGSLDDRIALLRDTNTTLEAIAQAMFKSWFVDFDPVHAKQEGRDPEGMDADTAALFPDSFEESELGLVPKGWNFSAVYDLAQYINGAAYRAFEPNSEGRGLPIIKIAELKAGVTSQTGFSDIKMPLKYKINTRDILFSWSGNPDTSLDTFVWPYGEAWLNQHIFRVVPSTDEKRSFVLLTLKYLKPVFAEIARNKQTTGLGHVTVSDLKRLRVVHPQNLLLQRWNELVDPLVERAFIVAQQAQTLATIRDTLLPRLISGQLRLPNAEEIIEEATA